jgi:para-nitrobenzyl esterase
MGAAIDFMDGGPSQSEDCLYLNVWTPGTDGKRPVMVWIHGGAFVLGSGSFAWYAGANLAARGDVVVVTLNYRLGALGFMHLAPVLGDDFTGAANAAIADQIAALEWVRDNIAAFGGDPSNVTIFGESAGGMSVATIMGAPRARGLFGKAIPQSGAAHNATSSDEAAEVAQALMRELGVTDAGGLMAASAEQILEAQGKLMAANGLTGNLPFQPVVDGDLLPHSPIEDVRAGGARDVALLTGTNLDEFKLFAMMMPLSLDTDEALAQRLDALIGAGAGAKAAQAYKAARSGKLSCELPELWSAIWTDRVFRIPAIRLAEAQSVVQPKTYTYLFTWPSPMPALGSCHALEIPFVFGTLSDPMSAAFAGDTPQARELSAKMQDAWIAFARRGDPSTEELGEWPRYSAERRATMVLGAEISIEEDPGSAERQFWQEVL